MLDKNQKNAVTDSNISAGEKIHIGDIHYHSGNRITFRKVFLFLIPSLLVTAGAILWVGKSEKPTPPSEKPMESYQQKQIINSDHKSKEKSNKKKSPTCLSGTVTDEQGNPLVGVLVTVSGYDIQKITNEGGSFKLDLPDIPSSKQVLVIYSKEHYQSGKDFYFEFPKRDIYKQLKRLNQ